MNVTRTDNEGQKMIVGRNGEIEYVPYAEYVFYLKTDEEKEFVLTRLSGGRCIVIKSLDTPIITIRTQTSDEDIKRIEKIIKEYYVEFHTRYAYISDGPEVDKMKEVDEYFDSIDKAFDEYKSTVKPLSYDKTVMYNAEIDFNLACDRAGKKLEEDLRE